MPGSYKESARKLYEIALSQQGFFTTKQAPVTGVDVVGMCRLREPRSDGFGNTAESIGSRIFQPPTGPI